MFTWWLYQKALALETARQAAELAEARSRVFAEKRKQARLRVWRELGYLPMKEEDVT